MKRFTPFLAATLCLAFATTLLAAEPTFRESVDWLKMKYQERNEQKSLASNQWLTQEFTCTDSGKVVVTRTTKFKDQEGDKPQVYHIQFNLGEIASAEFSESKNGLDELCFFAVSVKTREGLPAIGRTGKLIDTNEAKTAVFWSTSKELAERVVKAFDNAIKLAPKDDLFK